MKKIISFVLIAFILSGCTVFRIHKMDIEQGNIILQEKVDKLQPGMSESEVKEIMGQPVLVNVFSPNRIEYVYTNQIAYHRMYTRRVTCIFKNNILKEVIS